MISKALVAASTKPIILSILLSGENYGYQIIQSVKRISGGKLEWSDGMLYPVLHRLEKDGFISSKWKTSHEGRLRKYYLITDLGKEELETEKKQWLSVHAALSKLWKPLPTFD
ncbi:MAG: PadR family transcriptional regulator [Candidatus Aminicenantes bacterium]|nr:PadR family transcriptional regulator [Candidatus Aminicenantes bacterium]